MEKNYTKPNSGECRVSGTVLDLKVLGLHSELHLKDYISSKSLIEIESGLNLALEVAELYDNPNFPRNFMQDIFISSQDIYDVLRKGHSLKKVQIAAQELGKGLGIEGKEFLDEAIAVAWADYSGAHAEFARQFGIMN